MGVLGGWDFVYEQGTPAQGELTFGKRFQGSGVMWISIRFIRNAVDVYVVPWPEFPIVSSYPHHPPVEQHGAGAAFDI